MRGFFSANGIVPQNYLTVNQVPVGVNLCAHGAGILFASEEALISSGYVEKLCIYALPDSISGRDIYIAYEEERYMSCVCQKLIEILQHFKIDNYKYLKAVTFVTAFSTTQKFYAFKHNVVDRIVDKAVKYNFTRTLAFDYTQIFQ